MEIFQNLKQARVRRSLTQEQAAEQLHTTRQTISSYETGRTQPDLDTLLRLAALYDTPVERLLYGDREARKRRRLHRAAWIVLAVYLAGLALLSAFRLAINLLLAIPGSASGSVTLTEELRPLWELRFNLGNALDAAFSLWSLFLLVVLLVMLFQDLSLRDPGPLRRRTVLFLLLTAGSFAATIPWGLFDPLFHTGNYRIAAYAGICYSLLVLLIDLSVLVWRKRRRRAA